MLVAAHRGCGQDAGCGSCVYDSDSTGRGAEVEELRPVLDGAKLLETDDTMGGFLRMRACGVCGQNYLKIRYLRRGRSPSGCNHFPETCPANGSIVSGWPAFSSKVLLPLPAPCAKGAGYFADRHLAGQVLQIVLQDRKSTRLNSSHRSLSRMPSSA